MRRIRSILAAVLSLCLLLGGGPALAKAGAAETRDAGAGLLPGLEEAVLQPAQKAARSAYARLLYLIGHSFLESARQGYMDAQGMAGYCLLTGTGTAKDEAAAVAWLLKAAEQGSSYAQYNLGYCYYTGSGVKKDAAQSFAWYLKSAEKGRVQAQAMAGYMYYAGIGTARNYKEAVKWLTAASEQVRAGSTGKNAGGTSF